MKRTLINDEGFDKMIEALRKKTAASYSDVLKSVTGEVLEGAARNTYKTKKKIVKEAINETLSVVFVASNGDKVQKALDGSLIYKAVGTPQGAWVRVRDTYKVNAIGAKNPAGRYFSSKMKARINRALAELRKKQQAILKVKAERIGSSQKSFIEIMKMLRIPVRSTRGIGRALKAKITSGHKRALNAKFKKNDKESHIIIKSESRAALNPTSRGIDAFGKSFNGKIKEFKMSSSKSLKGYAMKFAKRHGFAVK